MRMNISVPDALAEEVRRRDVAISAVCQRALRDEITRLREIENVTDIQIYVQDDQPDPDPNTWPGYDPAKPQLVYGRHAEHGYGWTLFHEVDGQLEDYFIGGFPDRTESALRDARREIERWADSDVMEKITVEVGDPALTVGFTGRWLVEPDMELTRTSEDGYDNGAYWGVALTKRGRIAVFTAHVNDRWPASLQDYDSLDRAAEHVPADIIARVAAELGETRVLWRDI